MGNNALDDEINKRFIDWMIDLDERVEKSDKFKHGYVFKKLYNYSHVFTRKELANSDEDTVKRFLQNLPDLLAKPVEKSTGGRFPKSKYPVLGMYVSNLCKAMPHQRYFIPTAEVYEELKLKLDFLFYDFRPSGTVEVSIDGPVGDYCFNRARVEAVVKGDAGNFNAKDFLGGYVKFTGETGNNTAEGIINGDIEIYRGGDNIALEGNGGHVKVIFAGDNLAKYNSGASVEVWGAVGENLAYKMQHGVVRAHCIPGPGVGHDMKGGRLEFEVPESSVSILEDLLPDKGSIKGKIEVKRYPDGPYSQMVPPKKR